MQDLLKNSFQKLQTSKFFPILCYLWLGIFSTLAFLPYQFTHFVWIAPWSLFLLEKRYRTSYKKLFWHGTWAGVFVSLFSYYWIVHLFTVFGGFPAPIAFLLFIGSSFTTNVRFGIFLMIFSYLRRKIGKQMAPIAAFAMLFAEFTGFQTFPWYFGNLLAGNSFLAQNIEYIGVYGLSILVMLVSFSLFKIISNLPYYKNRRFNLFLRFSLPYLSALLFFFLSGYLLFQKWNGYKPEDSVEVMMIQPDAPLEFRDGRSIAQTLDDVMKGIERMAIEEGEKTSPDIIVLPESAVPFLSANDIKANNLFNRSYSPRFEALIFLLANRFKSNVYFNELDSGFLNDSISRRDQIFYNNSAIYDPNGDRKGFYRKSFLLAFGEYIPLGDKIPFLYDLIPQVAKFFPGKEQNLLPYFQPSVKSPAFNKSHLRLGDTNFMNLKAVREYYEPIHLSTVEKGKFLPLICYEVILPEFVRKFGKNGNPDFIINITNDKWYGKSVESFQHLELARIRSIEYRRWMVRSTNSGTSVFVNHLGQVVNDKYTDIYAPAVYSSQVDVIRSEPTFYVKYGDALVWGFLDLFGMYLLYHRFKKLRVPKNSES